MTPQAHRVLSFPPRLERCPTCERRDRLFAALILLVFVAVFVRPAVWP